MLQPLFPSWYPIDDASTQLALSIGRIGHQKS